LSRASILTTNTYETFGYGRLDVAKRKHFPIAYAREVSDKLLPARRELMSIEWLTSEFGAGTSRKISCAGYGKELDADKCLNVTDKNTL
jgi:hypothetical protein